VRAMNRGLMAAIILLAAGVCWSAARAGAMGPRADDALPFTLKQVGAGVFAAVSPAEGNAGANAGFVIGDDGVAVIDTFEDPAAARAMLGEIRKLTKLPVRFVINTHYHLDHVAGNGVFAETGATIVAHRNVRAWIHTENLKFFGEGIKPEERKMVEELVAPAVVYDQSLDLFLGSRHLVVRHWKGHTGGDTVVEAPDAHVVFCGDLMWRKTLPNLIDASTEPWIATLDNWLAAPHAAETTYIPGHGDVAKIEDVRDFRNYLAGLRAAVGAAQTAAKSGDSLVAAVLPGLQKKYGQWDFFNYFAKSNILDTAKELKGDKRVPLPAKE